MSTAAAGFASRAPELVYTGSFVGVDLGQAQDYTALAIARRFELRTYAPRQIARQRFEQAMVAAESRLDVVHLERLRLGTKYPDVVRRVQEIVEQPALRSPAAESELRLPTIGGGITSVLDSTPAALPSLVVDATGVGRPVMDMLRAAGLTPVGITITAGDKAHSDAGMWRVPKRELVSVLQVLLQTGRLKVASDLALASTFVDELLRFRVKIDPATAHDSYGSWREGEHDDLVLAAAVACWYAERVRPRDLSGSYPIVHR